MTTATTRTRARFIEVTLIVFGLYSLALGLFMLFFSGVRDAALGAARHQPHHRPAPRRR